MTEQEFDVQVRQMEGKMYRIARSMLRTDFDCADAIQNALLAAWRRLHTLRDEKCFEPWLMRILVNACRDVQRSYRRKEQEMPMEEALISVAVSPKDLDLHFALEKLPVKWKLPVLLHHMNGISVPDVAKILRLPPSTVKSRIRDGLKKLRKLLGEEEK